MVSMRYPHLFSLPNFSFFSVRFYYLSTMNEQFLIPRFVLLFEQSLSSFFFIFFFYFSFFVFFFFSSPSCSPASTNWLSSSACYRKASSTSYKQHIIIFHFPIRQTYKHNRISTQNQVRKGEKEKREKYSVSKKRRTTITNTFSFHLTRIKTKHYCSIVICLFIINLIYKTRQQNIQKPQWKVKT